MDWTVYAQQKSKSPDKATLEQKRTLRQGVPEDGVLSPTLFLIFIREPRTRTYKEQSMQTTLRYGAVKNTSPLQTTGCNKHSK